MPTAVPETRFGPRKPPWLKVRLPLPSESEPLLKTVRRYGLETVCREARCPNAMDCHARGTATFMILGAVCTRACRFCAVTSGRPEPVDPLEPARLALAVRELDLKHCVITSVDRDDLPDFGAGHFAACIGAVRSQCPETTIEVLTPDFQGDPDSIATVVAAAPDVYNHNLETVPRLSPRIRPKAIYEQSLQLLARVKRLDPGMTTKSGIMVGLGERDDEVRRVMADMRRHDIDIVTIGQYLRPSPKHAAVERYVHPREFAAWSRHGRELGFRHAFCGPLVRSSFHAGEVYEQAAAAPA